jgi:hypothetical protein
MAGKEAGRERREFANNPGVHPRHRKYLQDAESDATWEATTTSTTTTTTTVAATTTGA